MNLILEQQTMIQNLKDYIHKNSRSLSEFAKAHDLHLSNLSNTLNGRRKFSLKLAFELEDKLNLERGFFTKAKDESIKIPFVKVDNNSCSIQFDNAYFSITTSALVQTTEYKDLFAIHSSINIDREPLNKSVDKSHTLIFDSSMLKLIDDKIYLVEYLGHLILRKFKAEIAGFVADVPEIYAAICDLDKIKILARLVYVIGVEAK